MRLLDPFKSIRLPNPLGQERSLNTVGGNDVRGGQGQYVTRELLLILRRASHEPGYERE